MGCGGNLQSVDATLAELAREATALRLRLGQLLEVIGRGAVFELGFSSLGAYAANKPVIVDTKNLLDPAALRQMGFQYIGIGRA